MKRNTAGSGVRRVMACHALQSLSVFRSVGHFDSADVQGVSNSMQTKSDPTWHYFEHKIETGYLWRTKEVFSADVQGVINLIQKPFDVPQYSFWHKI